MKEVIHTQVQNILNALSFCYTGITLRYHETNVYEMHVCITFSDVNDSWIMIRYWSRPEKKKYNTIWGIFQHKSILFNLACLYAKFAEMNNCSDWPDLKIKKLIYTAYYTINLHSRWQLHLMCVYFSITWWSYYFSCVNGKFMLTFNTVDELNSIPLFKRE